MKILLVYPEYPVTFWSFKHVLKFVGKKAAFPPLGLLTVAAMLPQNWEIKLIDLNVGPLLDKDIKWADMIFISAMMIQKLSAQEVINRCNNFHKVIVVGGPAFTAEPEKYSGVTHFVLGEAEITLPIFLDDLKQGSTRAKYEQPPGVWADVTKIPVPIWSLINFNDYTSMTLQFERGCPLGGGDNNACEFCDIYILFGTKVRAKTASQMIKEFESLYQAGWRGTIFLADDNSIGHKYKFREMLLKLIIWQQIHHYPFRLITEVSINLADEDELMELMVKANFEGVFIGIESNDQASLESFGKVVNLKFNLEEAVLKILDSGLEVMGGFMIGSDGDPNDIFDKQIAYIKKTGIVTAMVGLLIALPRTNLWHRLIREGRLLGDTNGDNVSIDLNFIPKMNRELLLAGYCRVLETIYSKKEYFKRIDTFLKYCRSKTKSHLSWGDIRSVLLSFWHLGLASSARWYFWKLLIKTSLTDFRSLPRAITMAVYWLHFSKIAAAIKN